MNSAHGIKSEAQKAIDATRRHIEAKISDMRNRGVRIETSYGEIDFNPADSAKIANLVEQLMVQKLALLKPAVPAVLAQDNGAGCANAVMNQLLSPLVEGGAA